MRTTAGPVAQRLHRDDVQSAQEYLFVGQLLQLALQFYKRVVALKPSAFAIICQRSALINIV
jgi:hypothetical protein